ncbi:MAG: type-F conjugative transfer system secretin TraK [Pseudomonadota bacterium]
MIDKFPSTLPLALAFALAALPTRAIQIIEARDGVTIEAVMANKEATRIRIENAPITDVFGNLYSSNCAPPPTIAGAPAPLTPAASAAPTINPAGEIALECDRDKGEIYVRPMGDSTKPVNLFVSSAHATYTLLLRRSDTPSDTIVIRDKSSAGTAARPSSRQQGPLGSSANHIRAMKAMLMGMATGRVAHDVQMEEINRPMHLWSEARFSLLNRYSGRGLVGEKYLLLNISEQNMVLTEQEFDRTDGDVVGVAIDNLNLRPGDSTHVYVIRLGERP